MRKFNYLVLLCCLFITQGIFAQNMHRDITLNGVNVSDFVNKTIVMKFNTALQTNEYYVLASYKQTGATQKNRIVFFRLSSSYTVLESYYYYNIAADYDFVINDMIVDTDGNFAFCGNVTISNVTYGLVGKIDGTTYAMSYLKRITNTNSNYTSIGLISNASSTRYTYTGVVNYKQIYSQATYAIPSLSTLHYAYTGASFTDNAPFTGSIATDNRSIAVGFVDNNIIKINAYSITLASSISRQIQLLSPYTIEGDAVIGKISTNEYALAIGIRDNSSSTSSVGFFLAKLYFDCSGGVATLNSLDQKLYFFGIDKCLVTDVCYDPDEMKICVSGRLIQSMYGRPYVAKIDVANFSNYNARYFAYSFPDNNTQGYDLNKIFYNTDAMALVSAGNIRFTTVNQNAGAYIIEGYGSPMWEDGTCGDENLAMTSLSISRPLITTPSYTGLSTTLTPISLTKTLITSTSDSKCTGFYGYSVHRPIHRIISSETTEITVLTKENNTLQISGAKIGSTYRIYNMTGNIVTNGTIDSNGLVGYDSLNSGMYIIAISSHNELLKTFKFIRL